MARFSIPKPDWISHGGNNDAPAIRKEAFQRFGPRILGLGDIVVEPTAIDGLAAIFDLEGFTDFCSQPDPQLALPDFMAAFLDWLFESVAASSVHKELPDRVELLSPLPSMAKFLGDGVLFVWDTKLSNEAGQINAVAGLLAVCRLYKTRFLPGIRRQVARAPRALRCGIAKGRVFALGQGDDYVGVCINLAARLQKLAPGITFAFSRRGIDPESFGDTEGFNENFVLKKVSIRGIGDSELVYVIRKELEALSDEEKARFAEP